MDEIRFSIPGKAVPWKAPQVVQRGKFRMAYSPKVSSDKKKEIQEIARFKMDGEAPLEGPVFLNIRIYHQIPKSYSKKKNQECLENSACCMVTPDVTNVVKLVEDGLKGIVFVDDKQVCQQANHRYWSLDAGVNVWVGKLFYASGGMIKDKDS